MLSWKDTDTASLEQKTPDWYDRITKAGLLIVGILNLVQDQTSWFPYVFFFVVLLVSYPLVNAWLSRWKKKRMQRRALQKFSDEFRSYVAQAGSFVQSSYINSIPYYLRTILGKVNPGLAAFSSYVESVFSGTFVRLEERIKNNLRKYDEFDLTSSEFCGLIDSLVLIYVDQVIRELKSNNNIEKLEPDELGGLKRRYQALAGFIDAYNRFRSEVATFWGEESPSHQIRIPHEVLD